MRYLKTLLITLGFPLLAGAQEMGRPSPWQLFHQEAASPVMRQVMALHVEVLYIIFGIALLVTALIGYAMWRFRATRNPTPSKHTHNTLLEIVWTLVPVVILIIIAVPSLRALYYMDRAPACEMTVKVIGHQWYWSYEYPDHGTIKFDSIMIPVNELQPGQLRLLSVDNPLIVPVGKNVRIIATSDDVIHSWAVPALGVKKDTVPGRLNETWFHIERPGTYYGQCSELCGSGHGFMPIEVRAVSQEDFERWIKSQQPSKRLGAKTNGA